MSKIYQFFTNGKEIENSIDFNLINQTRENVVAMLELYNLNAEIENLSDVELFSLHNALIRVKLFQDTGKVLIESSFKN
jgi:hypothetical protein